MSLKIGVIGLGPMGGTIARNLLQKQFKVGGHDIDAARMADLDEFGLQALSSVSEVADFADVVITSLPSAEAVDAVVVELAVCAGTEQVVIECSTLAIADKLAAHATLHSGGKHMLDAPISGTPAMLAKLMASIHVSGDEDAYRKCVPVLEGFTASNFYVGAVGNGSKMKILANYLVHVHTTAAAECMVLGEKAGLAPELIHSVLCASAGASKMLDIRGAMMAKSDYREGGGTMFAVYEKDASIITEFAASVKAPIDLYVSSRQKFNSAIAQGLGHLDTSAVCKAIETAAGIDREVVE